jgi:hypothetical protein
MNGLSSSTSFGAGQSGEDPGSRALSTSSNFNCGGFSGRQQCLHCLFIIYVSDQFDGIKLGSFHLWELLASLSLSFNVSFRGS